MCPDGVQTVDTRRATKIFLLIISAHICLYTFCFNGIFRVDDEHILAARSQSMALWGEFSQPQVYGNTRVLALIPFGDQATQVEPAYTVLGAGLYRLATALGFGGGQALFSLNIYLTAFTAGIIFLIVLSLGYRLSVATWCAFLFGAGSMAWPYATTYYRDSLAMLMSSIAFLGWAWATGKTGRLKVIGGILVICGIIGGMLAKNTAAAMIPALVISGGILWLKSGLSRKRLAIGLALVLGLAVILYAAIAALPGEGPLARYSLDYYRFLAGFFMGSLNTGFLAAVLGPFISPAKSVLLFSPPLFLVFAGVRRAWKSSQFYALAALLFTVSLAVAQALFYRDLWAGTYGWGLRYMLPALSILFPLLAAPIEAWLKGKIPKHKILLWSVLIASVVIQISGAIVTWRLVYFEWQSRGLDPYVPGAAWDPRFLAIPEHILRLTRPGDWSVAWMRLLHIGRLEGFIAPFLALVLGGCILWALKFYLRGDTPWRWRQVVHTLTITLALVLPIIPTWWGYRQDPAWGADRPELHVALTTVTKSSQPGDVVVIDSYGTPLWAFWINRWDQPQRWYSLPYEIPGSSMTKEDNFLPSKETLALFDSLEGDYSRLWYVTSDATPDYALEREVGWLKSRFVLEDSQSSFSETRVDILLFRLENK